MRRARGQVPCLPTLLLPILHAAIESRTMQTAGLIGPLLPFQSQLPFEGPPGLPRSPVPGCPRLRAGAGAGEPAKQGAGTR